MKRKLKKIKLFPAPHTEIVLHVSDQMVKDMETCCAKALKDGNDCEKCSWKNVEPYGIDMCGIGEVVNKVLFDVGDPLD